MISIHHREGRSLPTCAREASLISGSFAGRPSLIRPGKPVYRSAFQQLLADPVFSASIEFQINAHATTTATTELTAASKSLIEL